MVRPATGSLATLTDLLTGIPTKEAWKRTSGWRAIRCSGSRVGSPCGSSPPLAGNKRWLLRAPSANRNPLGGGGVRDRRCEHAPSADRGGLYGSFAGFWVRPEPGGSRQFVPRIRRELSPLPAPGVRWHPADPCGELRHWRGRAAAASGHARSGLVAAVRRRRRVTECDPQGNPAVYWKNAGSNPGPLRIPPACPGWAR